MKLAITAREISHRPVPSVTNNQSVDRSITPGELSRRRDCRPPRVGDKIQLTVTIVAREHYHHGR